MSLIYPKKILTISILTGDCILLFSDVLFALRIVQIYAKDDQNISGPTLILGFYPINLPTKIATWEPILERLLMEIFVKKNRCIATHLSEVTTGFIFPYFANQFEDYIILQSCPPTTPKLVRQDKQTSTCPDAEDVMGRSGLLVHRTDSIESLLDEYLGFEEEFPSFHELQDSPSMRQFFFDATNSELEMKDDHRTTSRDRTETATTHLNPPDHIDHLKIGSPFLSPVTSYIEFEEESTTATTNKGLDDSTNSHRPYEAFTSKNDTLVEILLSPKCTAKSFAED